VNSNLNKALNQLAKIYFVAKDTTDERFIEKILSIKSKFNVSDEEWDETIEKFEQYKFQLEKVNGIELSFNQSLGQAYALHDTNLEFLLSNTTNEYIEASIYWDDKDTPDDLDLNIKTYQSIAPSEQELMSGDHVFARAGRKTITDMELTIIDEDDKESKFTVLPFKVNIEISPENINQQNINTISIKGRNVVDASNMTQNVDSKAGAEEEWQRLNLIPNSIHLINEMTGVVDADVSSQSSEEIKLEEKFCEPLASKIHVNPEGDTKRDFHPTIDPEDLGHLERNRKKNSESSTFKLFPDLENIARNIDKCYKKVGKIPDYDYPVYSQPYYEEYSNGDIKHIRLPSTNAENSTITSFFYDKIETLGISDRVSGGINLTNEKFSSAPKILRCSWGIETAIDRYSVVSISDDDGDTYDQSYLVHDSKDLGWSMIFDVTAGSDKSYCYQSSYGSRDLPISSGQVWQLGHTDNGYFDKISKQFRKLENWGRSSDVQMPMDDLQDHGDKQGSFEEKISDITTRHQTFKREHHHGDLFGDISTKLDCCAKVDGLDAGIIHSKECTFLFQDNSKYYYDISLNNQLRISNSFERINFNQLTIAQFSQPQPDQACWRGYWKFYFSSVTDNNEYPYTQIGLGNCEDRSSSSWLLRHEENRFGVFVPLIDTSLFEIFGMESIDEMPSAVNLVWDNQADTAKTLQFVGAQQENGSRNYFSNPKSLLEYVFHKIKHEIDQGSPPMKLFDEITAHRADEFASNAGEMLDDPLVRKVYRAKHPGEYDLLNAWIAEEAGSRNRRN
jgi:hypothetical protein